MRDPYNWYEVPEEPGPVMAVGQGWVTYQTGPQSYSTVLGGVQRTWVDDDGTVRLVDNDLVPDPGSGALVNAANDFMVSVPVSGDGTGIVFERDGFRLTLTPAAGDFSHPVAKGNAVLFNDVFLLNSQRRLRSWREISRPVYAIAIPKFFDAELIILRVCSRNSSGRAILSV